MSQFPFFVTLKTNRVQSSNATPYFNISTSYLWTNLTMSGGFSRDQQPSAYGAVYEVNRLFLTCGYNFTERLRGSLTGGYSLSNQTSQTINSRYNYYNLSPSLTYQVTEKMSVSPGYSYSANANLTSTGGSAHAHMAWIQLSYTYPMHYQK